MSLIVGLEHQPNFPGEDLSDKNAALLELLLQNLQFVEEGHLQTEGKSWIYKVGHPVVAKTSSAVYDSVGSQQAIDHGIKLFESMISLVTTPPERIAPFAAERTFVSWVHGKSVEEFRNYSFDTVDSMREQVPITAETICQATKRQCGHLTSYALLGAALSRQFELDCVNAGEM